MLSFPCGQCGKLMMVGPEMLGHQVRCPHCQQVVQAPAAAASGPPAFPGPEVNPPGRAGENTSEKDSIFAPPEGGDDLFGVPPVTPLVEMPPAVWHTPPPDQPASPAPPSVAPSAVDASPPISWFGPAQEPLGGRPNPLLEPPAMFTSGAAASPEIGTPAVPEGPEAFAGASQWPAAGGGDPADFAGNLPPAGALHPAERRASASSGIGMALVLIFLLPYAIVATAAAIYFYLQRLNTPHPLEVLPDIEGNKPGATRKQSSITIRRVVPDAALPAKLRVPLHQSIRIGDLEVTPEKIEERKVVYAYKNSDRQHVPAEKDALVLTLHLRNISADDFFVPTDAAFCAKWTGDSPKTKPYTFLEVGSRRFYGGPAFWDPRAHRRGAAREDDLQEYIEGQENFEDVLKPGQERDVIICTDPENAEVLEAVHHDKGPLLWRVELRRGLVRVEDREVSACAVVGIEFTQADVD